jgi:hypothetical protein
LNWLPQGIPKRANRIERPTNLYPIRGWEGLYSVDEIGNVFSERNRFFLKQNLAGNGYPFVTLHRGKQGKHQVYIHRIIAEMFLSNPKNKPEVNHNDGNKLNNHISNLEWMTSSENNIHAIQVLGVQHKGPHLQGELNGYAKLTEQQVLSIRKERREGKTLLQIGTEFGITFQHVSDICLYKCWRHI